MSHVSIDNEIQNDITHLIIIAWLWSQLRVSSVERPLLKDDGCGGDRHKQCPIAVDNNRKVGLFWALQQMICAKQHLNHLAPNITLFCQTIMLGWSRQQSYHELQRPPSRTHKICFNRLFVSLILANTHWWTSALVSLLNLHTINDIN